MLVDDGFGGVIQGSFGYVMRHFELSRQHKEGNMEQIIDKDGYMEIVFGSNKLRIKPQQLISGNVFNMTREEIEEAVKNAILAEIETMGLV